MHTTPSHTQNTPWVFKFQLSHDAVVRRRDRERAAADAALDQPPQQRDAQRRALHRISACPQLVKENEALAVSLCAQRLDPGVNNEMFKKRQFAIAGCMQMYA